MANPKVQFRWGLDTAVQAATVTDGYIYFAYDTGKIYLDYGTTRYVMSGVDAGVGLTTANNGRTIKAKLKSETASTLEAAAMGSTASRQYAVGVDKNGVLSVNVPWENDNTTYTGTSPITVSGSTISHAASGVTAGSYGPSAAVTGTEGTTMNVPYITVNATGHVTAASNKVYTSKNTTYTSLKNPYSLTIQGNGTTLTNGVYDGSGAKTVNITASAIGALPADGTAAKATALAASHDWSITGAVTAAAVSYDGTNDVVLEATAVDATKLTGTISADRLPTIPLSKIPATAQERVVTVADDTARFALTTSSVQDGDVVRVTDTGKMYFVVDQTKLNSADGYAEFSAGTASSATYDSASNKIDETYIKNITRSGTTFTATRGDNTTFTFTQQDNNTDTKVTQTVSTANKNYPILLSYYETSSTTATAQTANRSAGIYANPSTGTITATNFSGKINNYTVSTDVPANAVFTDTTYTAASGGGLSLSGTAFSIADSGVTANSYGPTANVTGTNNTTIKVPQITVNAKGQITAVTERTYTSKDTTYSAATQSAAGLMSAADKTKLDGLSELTWAEV